MGRRAVWIGALVLAGVSPARADEPITDRDYAIDFYEGVAIGNTAWVGMGGAGAALIVGTAGTLINPSAPAVRQTTDTDPWSWDYHIDYLTGRYATDYDNNGIVVDEGGGAQLITAGIGLRYHDWATALTVSGQSAPILNGTVTPTDDLTAEALRFRYVISKYVPSRDIAVGIGVQNVMFQVTEAAGEALFSINGTGIMAGATYVPRLQSFRVAGAIETRILGAEVTSTCDPDDCRGYILPEKVTSPARLIAGFAYRFAETPWNSWSAGHFATSDR